jgi:hypothetical protein
MKESEISESDAQALLDAIASISHELGLEPVQILDGVSRSLLSLAVAFGTKKLSVDIDDVGTCKVNLTQPEGHSI